MAQSKYFQINPIRRQQNTTSDVQRGLQVGQEIGKLMSGLAGAIKGAQADAAANQLMTGQNIANQPGAGVTQDLGKLGDDGGPQPAAGDTVDPNADLSTDLPENVSSTQSVQVPPQTFSNPSTGNVETAQGTGSTYSGTAPDPAVAQNVAQTRAASQLGGGSDFTLNPSNYSSGGTGAGTVGGLQFTGGVAGMKMQQEFQKSQVANQLQKLQLQKAQRDAAAAQQEDAGTGRFALDAQIKQAQLGEIQARTRKTQNPSGSSTKQPKYVAGSGDYENDETTDDANQIKSDFEAFHPGLFGKFQGATVNANGDYEIPGKGKDANGNPIPEAVIPKAEGDIFQQRVQAAKRRAGIPYIDPSLTSGSGTAQKPVVIDQSVPGAKLRLRSLPPGTVVQDAKTGQKFTIQRSGV